jgi:two-component system nitrate/nitrite response regulator NarL
MIRIAIGEDHISLIEGVELFMKQQEDIKVVGCTNNGKDLVELVLKKRPDVVIADIRMPIMDGILATKEIKKKSPLTKIIAFTMFDQKEAVSEMLAAGANGYILKNSHLSDLLNAVRAVANGESYFDPQMNLEEGISATRSNDILTKRELEILRMIAQGCSNTKIAESLFIEESTVATHRKNMILKLGLTGKGELLRYALERKYEFK